jgi:hypothetical protein
MDESANSAASPPLVTFYRFIPECRMPQRADSSAAGSLPTRAFRFCEAIRMASAFGWYVFPPIRVSFMWDGGTDITWTYQGADEWYPLKTAQFPGFAEQFDAAAPDDIKGFSPPFVGALQEPGVVQIWSGLVARTAPGWSLLVRGPANLPRSLAYEVYEGIVETDRWFGPLFTNLRLIKTDVPIHFSTETPLVQVQPLHRRTYAEEVSNGFGLVADMTKFPAEAWSRYEHTIVKPNLDPARPVAAYASSVRRRRRGGCPVHAS